jgi:tRNA (mo5U34)-methyltransferase
MSNSSTAASNGKLRNEIESLGPWFHNLHLPNGVQTAPENSYGDFPQFKWDDIKHHIPADLSGMTALDIGCNAGFYTFELAKRGAQVLGIDLDPHYLRQADWAAMQMGLRDKVQFRQMQVYDLAKLDEQFDVIIFMGVFYHLRYPMLALDIVTQKLKKFMVFQTLTVPGEEVYTPKHDIGLDERKVMLKKGWPTMAFIERRLAGDPTNWWAPNHSCIEAMLRTCGLKVTARPGHEMYIAEPDASLLSVMSNWNRSEYLSALGKEWLDELNPKLKH